MGHLVDGQQRLRTFWQFRPGELRLEYPDGLPEIDGRSVAGLKFDEIHPDLKTRFDNFVVSICEILVATTAEITNLFSRLQMGVVGVFRTPIRGPSH